MKRRDFLKLSAFTGASLTLPSVIKADSANAKDRPNVLFIAVDDQLNNGACDKGYAKICRQMDEMLTEKLKESDDPRMFGKGNLFKEYKWQ